MIHFTLKQRQALHASTSPVEAIDPETKQQYVILHREAFEKIKRVLGIAEIDPSLFEFDEIDVIVNAPHQA